MAMGVRKGDHALAAQLSAALARDKAGLTTILTQFGVKLYKPPDGGT